MLQRTMKAVSEAWLWRHKKAVSLPELEGPVKKWASVLGAVVTIYLSVYFSIYQCSYFLLISLKVKVSLSQNTSLFPQNTKSSC